MKALLLVSVLIVAFGAISERWKRSPLTPPIVFVAVGAGVLVDEGVPGRDQILSAVVVTVLMSVYLHGVTAWPASKAYRRSCDDKRYEAMEEWMPAPELPTRLR